MANEIWASDANYPAGAQPWSGGPTKVEPDAGEITAGHAPGVPVPAETENWWKNRVDSKFLGTETIVLSMRDAALTDATFQPSAGEIKFASGVGGSAEFGVTLPVGRKIVGIRARVKDGGAGKEMNIALHLGADGVDFFAGPIAEVESSGSAAAEWAALVWLYPDAGTETIVEGQTRWIVVEPVDPATDKYLYAISIDHGPA